MAAVSRGGGAISGGIGARPCGVPCGIGGGPLLAGPPDTTAPGANATSLVLTAASSKSTSSNELPTLMSVPPPSAIVAIVPGRVLPIDCEPSRRASCAIHSFSSVCPADWYSVRSTRSTSTSISSAVW